MQNSTNEVEKRAAELKMDTDGMRSEHGQKMVEGLLEHGRKLGQLETVCEYVDDCEEWGGYEVWDDCPDYATLETCIADYNTWTLEANAE